MSAGYVYTGWVRHRRFRPRAHAFRSSLYMIMFDPERIEELEASLPARWMGARAPLAFRRRDYHGSVEKPLADAVRDTVEAKLGQRPEGRILLLTQLACFGICFNPVSFYYCHNANGSLLAVMAEITNTPWGQRHVNVIPADASGRARLQFRKDFHVSPFMPMDQHYDWRFNGAGQKLVVHMITADANPDPLFDATLSLRRKPFDSSGVRHALLRWPLMTLKVVSLIYVHALRLWLKGVPFHPHPDKRKQAA